jgi:hypothetical protein
MAKVLWDQDLDTVNQDLINAWYSYQHTFCFFFFLWLQLLLVTGINQSLGISNEWFSIGDSLVLTVLGQVQIPASFSIGFVSSLVLRVCIPPCAHLFEELPYSSEDLLA